MERTAASHATARAILLGMVVALLVTLCTLLSPVVATADDAVAYSEDNSGERTYYYSIDDAMNAGFAGAEIFLSCDWKPGYTLTIGGDQHITIDLNGHAIRSTNSSAAIHLDSWSELFLKSEASTDISFWGYVKNKESGSWGWSDTQVTSGGLVTDTMGGTGITTDKTSTLSLENVTVAGCNNSGVIAGSNTVVLLRSGARISNNYSAEYGGGVRLEDYGMLLMVNSSVCENYCGKWGGGVFAESNCKIDLNENTKIDDNEAKAGGGIYINSSECAITSYDYSGSVSGNTAFGTSSTTGDASGGGIHVDKVSGTNECTIEGLTIANNYSAHDGGGVEADQEYTRLSSCTIKNNTTAEDGGGVLIFNDDCSLTNCTVTGNVCNDKGKNYEGGGVFAGYEVDVELHGTCIIKGNTRGKNGSADDVFLSANAGNSRRAYILGGVDKGSKVGVRTGTTGNRKIAKDLSSNAYGAFFMDLSDYYVSYEHDTYGSMWQDQGVLKFMVNVNGKETTRFKQGEIITADGSSKDAGKHFWYWDADASSGMYPVSEYINDKNKYNALLSYTMPQNDTNAVAVYADVVKEAEIEFDTTTQQGAAQLNGSAKFRRTDGGTSGDGGAQASVTWYEVSADGARTPVAGKAKAGVSYVASVSVSQNQEAGLFFSKDLAASGVTLEYGSSSIETASVSVDAATGTLIVETAPFQIEGAAKDDSKTATLSVALENGGLQATAGDSSKSAQDIDDSVSLGTLNVSYAEGAGSVTVAAPNIEGMNFCYWGGIHPSWCDDVSDESITIPAEDLAEATQIRAVYTPVVTSIELGVSAPVAGKKLTTAANKFAVKTSDGNTVDFLADFNAKSFKVSWSPVGKSAACSAVYAARVEIDDDAGYFDLDDMMADNATVTFAGGEEATSAGFAVVGGKLCLCVVAPKTAKVAKVADVTGLKAAKAGKGAVKVSWKKGNRSGVQVRYSTAKSMKGAKKATAKGKAKTAKKIKKLKSGKKYYFQVRAYKTVNGKRCCSSWSKKVSVKVK